MDRSSRKLVGVLCLLASTLLLCGCRPAALLYFLMLAPEPQIPAKFDKLKGKTVVVLTYASANARYAHATLDTEVRQAVIRELLENVKKIRIADPDQVARWCAEHEGYSLKEVGHEFAADYVIYIEIQKFSLQEHHSPQLYRGSAAVMIQVADVHQNGQVVWETYLESVFPTSRAVPASEMSLQAFTAMYVKRLSREIARHFFPYRYDETFTLY
jgi:ABC-type uncharacterized transport system auxiliary subunit